MASITLQSVSKRYAVDVVALDGVDLAIAGGEFLVLVGPSGCGKSTVLRIIAGLEDADSGQILIGDRVVNKVEPKDRDVAMVFQNYALYPHMSVEKNISFGLRVRGIPASVRRERVARAAALLELTHLMRRKPRELSGGQRQRVALGRAMVREPAAFLFDEPLSNLDARLRTSTRGELKKLHAQLGSTTVYVTHDQEEAMTLGDRVAVMHEGRFLQVGTPFEVYERPVNLFVARFIGSPAMNTLAGVVRGGNFHETPRAANGDAPGAVVPLPARLSALAPDGGEVVLGVRAQWFFETSGSGDAGASLTLTPEVIEPLGGEMDVTALTPGGHRVVARVPAHADLPVGTSARFGIDLERVMLFEPGDFGRNLALVPRSSSSPAAPREALPRPA